MLKRSVVLVCMLVTMPAAASGYLSGNRLIETLAGKSFIWPDRTVSTYARDGGYKWDGTTSLQGTWQVRGDKVCVTYSSGAKRCDKYIYNGDELQLVNAKGKHFHAEQTP